MKMHGESRPASQKVARTDQKRVSGDQPPSGTSIQAAGTNWHPPKGDQDQAHLDTTTGDIRVGTVEDVEDSKTTTAENFGFSPAAGAGVEVPFPGDSQDYDED